MQEKLEQVMRQIYLMLSNCEESAYSSEDIIVSKTRIFPLLEELNYAVYDLMEQYEGTVSARERGIAEQERKMAQIKEDAKTRAEDIYSASLMCARESFLDMQGIAEGLYKNVRKEYDEAMKLLDQKMAWLKENEVGTVEQIKLMNDSKKYLRLVEQQNREREKQKQLTEEERKLLDEAIRDQAEIAAAEAASEFGQKIAAPIVVQVNEQPKVPEGFASKKQTKKKKLAPSTALEETLLPDEGVVTPLPSEAMENEKTPGDKDTEESARDKKEAAKWAFWKKQNQ